MVHIHHTHERVMCSCGVVIRQCKCPTKKRERIVERGCNECILIDQAKEQNQMTDGQTEAARAQAAEMGKCMLASCSMEKQRAEELAEDVVKYRKERKEIVEALGITYSSDLMDVVGVAQSRGMELLEWRTGKKLSQDHIDEIKEFKELQDLIIKIAHELDNKANPPILRCALAEAHSMRFLIDHGIKDFEVS